MSYKKMSQIKNELDKNELDKNEEDPLDVDSSCKALALSYLVM